MIAVGDMERIKCVVDEIVDCMYMRLSRYILDSSNIDNGARLVQIMVSVESVSLPPRGVLTVTNASIYIR